MTAGALLRRAPDALLAAIREPLSLARLDDFGWEQLLTCARRNAVLAYLGGRAASAGVIDAMPDSRRASLISAQLSAARVAQLARWELDRVRRVLQPAGIPVIALKGVAYVLRELPHAASRRMSDIDVMVPRERIEAAERALLGAGWCATVVDAYDQRYYREWSHEIPPLLFPGRSLAVDVHHTICPPASRLRPDPSAFWSDSESSAMEGVRVLSPADSVLHAAVHLFFDSDFEGRFRDLVDLHELVSAFGGHDAFWPRLTERAREQGLGRPLYYALSVLPAVLGTRVPEATREAIRPFAPAGPIARWMNRTLATVLSPIDPEPWPAVHRIPLALLYARSHWTRMPPHRLFPHLLRKAMRRVRRGTTPGE